MNKDDTISNIKGQILGKNTQFFQISRHDKRENGEDGKNEKEGGEVRDSASGG